MHLTFKSLNFWILSEAAEQK